jgi:hypothetical protein
MRLIGEQRSYAAEITNGRYTRQIPITCDDCHSWVGLGHIHPNSVYPYHLSFLTLCLHFLVSKMVDDRRTMYDGFNDKGCTLCRIV